MKDNQNTVEAGAMDRAMTEAIVLIDEINKRASSREFYGINQTLHAKLCTIRATLLRAPTDQSALVAELVEAARHHIQHGAEPLGAMTDAFVAAIEAWKVNDSDAMDKAMTEVLRRIATSVSAVMQGES